MEESNSVEIGALIRKHRENSHISLRELARRTSLSASFLSQVETGKCKLSIASLQLIADVLEVPIHQLLYGIQPALDSRLPEERQQEVFFVTDNNCPTIRLPDRNMISQLRTPNLGRGLEVLCSTGYKTSGNTAKTLNILKREVIYLLSGCVRIVVDEQEYVLKEGDSLYFSALELQVFECISDRASWLSIIAHN